MEQDEMNKAEQEQQHVEKVIKPLRLSRKKLLFSRKDLNETETLLDQLRQCDDDDLKAIVEVVLDEVKQTLELEPEWLDEVYVFRVPDGREGKENAYGFRYDVDNLQGRKTIVEFSKQGKITRTITFKKK